MQVIPVPRIRDDGQAGAPTVKPMRLDATAQLVAIGAVTPWSLADQFNREAKGRDPASFFYPYGY